MPPKYQSYSANKKRFKKKAADYRKKWTLRETEMLFDNSITDDELSKRLKRSVWSIQTKRNQLKK